MGQRSERGVSKSRDPEGFWRHQELGESWDTPSLAALGTQPC